jgi:hypothetical protein
MLVAPCATLIDTPPIEVMPLPVACIDMPGIAAFIAALRWVAAVADIPERSIVDLPW